MHDLALLQRLTEKQLKMILAFGSIQTDKMDYAQSWPKPIDFVFACERARISFDLINEFLLASAMKFAEAPHLQDIVAAHYRLYDSRCSTRHAREHAIALGDPDLLLKTDGPIKWHHFFQAAYRALKMKEGYVRYPEYRASIAHTCFVLALEAIATTDQMPEAKQHILKGIESTLRTAIDLVDHKTISKCLETLERDLKPSEIRLYRNRLVRYMKSCDTFESKTFEAFSLYANETEKRIYMNAAARHGEEYYLYHASATWNIPITEKHLLRLHDGCIVEEFQLEICRTLAKRSARYLPLVSQSIQTLRNEKLSNGEVRAAHALALEIDQPLTLAELQYFIDRFRDWNHGHIQTLEIPFAIDLLSKLIGPRATKKKKKVLSEQVSTT